MGKSHIRIFLFLLLCSSFLFTFSQVGPLAYEQVFGEPRTYKSETVVGPVHIGGLTRTEARQKLASQAADWKDTHNVTLEMKENNIIFQKDFIDFDIPETLNQVEDGEQNCFVVDMNESYFGVLEEKVGTELFQHILIDNLSEKIAGRAETLHENPLQFSIYQYVEDGTTQLYEVVSEYRVPLGDEANLDTFLNEWNGAVIQNQKPFSILAFVSEDVEQPSLNRIATALYGAVLNTNFIINQRHISTKLPSYAELGKEASVKPKNNHDFVFTNPNKQTYQLNLDVENGELVVQISGYPLPNSYNITLENRRTIQSRTIVQFSGIVPSGESNIKVEGQEGTSVEVYRFVEDNGEVIRKEFISDDYYPPVNRVEVRYGTNDQASETKPTNNSSGFSSGGSDGSSGFSEGDHHSSGSSSTEKNSEPSHDIDNTVNNENRNNDETVEPGDIWEEPQGETKSEEK